MTTEQAEYVFEGDSPEEIIANTSGNLVKIIYDIAEQAEIEKCLLFDNAVQTFVLNMHMNGHAPCAIRVLMDALMFLKSLHEDDAEQPRH